LTNVLLFDDSINSSYVYMLFSYGCFFVNNSYIIIPKLQTELSIDYFLVSLCSGAWYIFVPLSPISIWLPIIRANPKSANLTCV